MADYQTIEAGSTLRRGFTIVRRSNGNPITAGVVNYYLKALTGANAGKWWDTGDGSWQAAETANAMTHEADGHWTRSPVGDATSPYTAGVQFLEYAKESGDLHVPTGRLLVAGNTEASGTGARLVTFTVQDEADTVIQGARVRMTRGVDTVVGTTGADGTVSFNVDDGSYDVAVVRVGYTFTPTVVAVTGDLAQVLTVTAVVPPAPSDPGKTTGFLTAFDQNGDPESGVQFVVTMRQVSTAIPGASYDSTPRNFTSGLDGVVNFTNLFKGLTYSFQRGTSGKLYIHTIPAAAGATYELPSNIGAP